MHRFYVDTPISEPGMRVALSPEESAHAARVLRLRAGEEVRLLDGDGQLLVSPRFTLAVYGTVYNEGDAVSQEGPSSMTVKSTQPGYSQVFLWSDGNP